MKKVLFFIISLYSSLLLAEYTLYDDPKYCGFVPRTSSGDIKRSAAMLTKFQAIHPCPSTGLKTGACPNFAIDHIVPLASCGCDQVVNMQWLATATKSCSDNRCKDRYERRIYTVSGKELGLNPKSAGFQIVPLDFFDEVVVTVP